MHTDITEPAECADFTSSKSLQEIIYNAWSDNENEE